MTDTELFNSENNESNESKYDSWDLEQLKKKAIAADNHIKTLEEETRYYKENNKTEETLKEVLERLDKTNNTQQNYQPTNEEYLPSEKPSSGDQVTKEDIEKVVSMSIEQKQKESLAKANVEKIRAKLKDTWGDNYSQKLVDRSKELGVNQTFLESMAENYPDAFLNLVLPKSDASNPNTHVPPSGSAPVRANQFTGDSYKAFRQMEKDNPELRHDHAFQRRKLEAAEKLGEAFYK